MASSRTYYSPQDIIAKGEALQKGSADPIEPWMIFKELGSRGKFDRVREIWADHVTSRSALGTTHATSAEDLSAHALAALAAALETAHQAVLKVLADEIGRTTAGFVRQIQVLQRTHVTDLEARDAQLTYWEAQAAACAEREEQIVAERDQAVAEGQRLQGELEQIRSEVERLAAERDQALLERNRAAAAARFSPLPIVGDRVPLVSPVLVPRSQPEIRPEPISRPSRLTRARVSSGKPEDTPIGTPGPEETQTAPLDPAQITMPF